MRTLSDTARRAISSQETDEIFLVIAKIDHSTFDAPLLFVNNLEDIIRDDGTYIGYPFSITLPILGEDNLPTITLNIDNVDKRISIALQSLQTAPSVDISVVLASAPNTVEAGPFECLLRHVEVPLIGGVVTATLNFEDLLNEPFPSGSFTPATAPGLFE